MFLIASPCYIWSQILVLFTVIGLFSILPEGDYLNDVEGWVMGLQLLTWIVMFVIGWYGSKLLIVKPKELQSMALKDQGKVGRDTPTMKESLTG